MDLGFALHPKWLTNSTLKDFLAPLKAAGMTVLEFALHPGTEEWAPMRALAEECVRAGYRCNFHGPYQDPFNPAGFATTAHGAVQRMYAPALELVERLAGEMVYEPIVVIHGAHAETTRAALRKDTESFLAWVLAEAPHARPVLENLPHKPPFIRTGESREEVLEIVHGMNDPRLGICWDLGHDKLLGYTDLPSLEFLRTVRHVHIHDINAAAEDHFPLVFGNVPWQADLRALVAVNFDGAIVMEINGQRARAVERLHERMAESFARMKETL